jgi:hypothetical protein
VFLYIRAVVRDFTLFVWVHYYSYLVTASFSCTLVTTITSGHFRCVTSYAASWPIAVRRTLKSGIELPVYLAFFSVSSIVPIHNIHSYINDAPLTHGVYLALFADDTCLYAADGKEGFVSAQWRPGVSAGILI